MVLTTEARLQPHTSKMLAEQLREMVWDLDDFLRTGEVEKSRRWRMLSGRDLKPIKTKRESTEQPADPVDHSQDGPREDNDLS